MTARRGLPEAILKDVGELLEDRLRPWIEPEESPGIEGGFLPDDLLEVTLFVDRPRSDERWACSVRIDVRGRDEASAIGAGLDAAEAALAEWLEAGRARRSDPSFTETFFEGERVGLRRHYRRPRAEAEATALLG